MYRGCSGSGSIFLRNRMTRRSTLRSNGSQSRFWLKIQDAFARERPVGLLRQRLQEIELERGHRHLFARLVGEPVGGEVEHAASDAHPFRADVGAARGRRAAEHALHACRQLTRIEGLGNVVVGTHLEAHDPIHDRAGGSQHHDGDLGVALAQVTGKAQAVLARHVDVDQREVDGVLRRQRLRGGGVFGRRSSRSRAR